MDQELRMTIGNRDTVQFILRLFSDQDHPRCLAWGALFVSLSGEPVWCAESEQVQEAPVTWAWIDLLEFLGDKWPWLVLEEQYPISINPLHPGNIRREAEKRWENMPSELYLEEDERLCRFEARHDLSMGLKGFFLPPLFMLRHGKRVWICTNGLRIFTSFKSVIAVLTEFGDCLAKYIGTDEDHRAARAVDRWWNREKRAKDLFWNLRTGLADELRRKLEGGQDPAQFWEVSAASDDYDNELLAAARLSAGFVSLEDQRTILGHIKETPGRAVCDLDGIAGKITPRLDERMRPYEQGYTVAQMLRQYLKMDVGSQVDPERILEGWGVQIRELCLDHCALDAVAAWGPSHGPVIILNVGMGGRASHVHGRRSTLAHEICHLLVDRNGALPFSEALGGHTPLYVEQRASAFAAEFLLPADSAVNRVTQNSSLQEALESLGRHFEVSIELAALQIKNSQIFFNLSEEEKGIIIRNTETHDAHKL